VRLLSRSQVSTRPGNHPLNCLASPEKRLAYSIVRFLTGPLPGPTGWGGEKPQYGRPPRGRPRPNVPGVRTGKPHRTPGRARTAGRHAPHPRHRRPGEGSTLVRRPPRHAPRIRRFLARPPRSRSAATRLCRCLPAFGVGCLAAHRHPLCPRRHTHSTQAEQVRSGGAGQGSRHPVRRASGNLHRARVRPVDRGGRDRSRAGVPQHFAARTFGGKRSHPPAAVALLVKERAIAAGLDPALYAGHSLRAGFATSAALGGAPEWAIMKQTGHKSRTMLDRYVRPAGRFRNNPVTYTGL